jgi:ADP-ribosyl-[dinitrogen reductase] hydrolase
MTTDALLPSLSLRDRARGALLGLACGDTVGAQVEFMPRDSFPPVRDMVGGGFHRINPGDWTDDTSMAACLAESLVTCYGHDPHDQLKRYLAWRRTGYLSPKGYCFDIGGATSRALTDYELTGEAYRASDGQDAGNPPAGATANSGDGAQCAATARGEDSFLFPPHSPHRNCRGNYT